MANRTNWEQIMADILGATPPKGHDSYTLAMIETKTGIGISTLSRLSTGDTTNLH